MSDSTLTITGDGAPATMLARPIGGGVEVTGADAGPGCVATATGASCPTDGSTTLLATLSAAPETLRVTAAFAGATVSGGEGADVLSWAAPSGASVRGGPGADRLVAEGSGTGAVNLIGEDDDDAFGLGARRSSGDSANGGAGRDTVTYAARTGGAGVAISLDGVRNDGAPDEGDLIGRTVEVLIGSTGPDTLTSADDLATTIDGGAGADTIGGLGGRDTLSYALTASRPAGVVADLGAGAFPDGDTVSGMENLTGSAGPDRLTGTQFPETLDGAGGNDILLGGGFQDTLVGGEGADTASYERATVPMIVDLGGGFPNNTGDTYSGIEGVRGGPFDDELRGASGDETLDGGPGADLLIGGFGLDTYVGGQGRDTVSYQDGRGGGGRIARDASPANLDGEAVPEDVEDMFGSEGDDVIVGGPGAERLSGSGGNDRFLTGPGADEVNGGFGDRDVLSFADQPGGALIRLARGRIASEFREGDRSQFVEEYEGSPAPDEINVADDPAFNVFRFDADDLVSYRGRGNGVRATPGTGADDGNPVERDDIQTAGIIEGTEFEDVFNDARADRSPTTYRGLGGDDLFTGEGTFPSGVTDPAATAADVFDGGEGDDRLEWFGEPVRISLLERRGSFNDDVLGIENLRGSEGNDVLIGDEARNSIRGSGGDDVLDGGGGNDTLTQEPGADAYAGGAGFDTIEFTRSTTGVTVTPNGLADDGDPGERDNVGADVDGVFGSPHGDRLTAIPEGHVHGLAGDDTLTPAAAPAFTRALGGEGTDTLDATRRSPGGLRLSTGAGALFGNLDYGGFENLIGGVGPDTLIGGPDANRLEGGEGSDVLDGGDGGDLVLGGPGGDAFTDGDAVADRFGGHTVLSAGNGAANEGQQANPTGPTAALPATKLARDDRLTVVSADPARTVVVDLSRQTTDRGDVVTDIESVIGTARRDRITGDGDENTLNGGGGDDAIQGGGNNDRINGEGGADGLSDSSPELDVMFGGPGDDRLRSVDASSPVIGDAPDCGDGALDQLTADLRDLRPSSCETLFSAPVNQHPLTRVRALSTRPDARGRVRVRISCPRAAGRTCRGAALIERGLLRRAKPVALASRNYRLRSGRSIAVRLRLERTARRALARRGRLNVRLAARELDADDRPRESSLPLRLRRARR